MRMRIAWQVPVENGSVCASSVAKYFSDAGYTVRLMQTQLVQRPEYSLRMPLLGGDDTEQVAAASTTTDGNAANEQLFASAADVVEYIGMISLGCEMEADSYLSGYSCVGRSQEIGNAAVGIWRGLFTSELVQKLVAELR